MLPQAKAAESLQNQNTNYQQEISKHMVEFAKDSQAIIQDWYGRDVGVLVYLYLFQAINKVSGTVGVIKVK